MAVLNLSTMSTRKMASMAPTMTCTAETSGAASRSTNARSKGTTTTAARIATNLPKA